METTELIILCLLAVFVVGLNVALIQAIRRSSRQGEIELFRKAARRARKPWESETASLEELARRVAPFKDQESAQAPDAGKAPGPDPESPT